LDERGSLWTIGALWRFHARGWVRGLLIAALTVRSVWHDRSIAVGNGAFELVGSVI
jgi:hypothetical protein